MKHPMLSDLPPVVLIRRHAECACGLVAIDAKGSMFCDAGVDVRGVEMVSVVGYKRDYSPAQRRKIADAAIKLWEAFAAE